MRTASPAPTPPPHAARPAGEHQDSESAGAGHADQTWLRQRRSARSARIFVTAALLLKLAAIALWIWTPWRLWAPVVFFGGGTLVVYHLLVPSASGVCAVFTRFRTERPEVWLTIDDGPDPEDTPRILDVLDRHEARATFFVIGTRAAEHPGLIREILRRGHTIGHHTHTHPTATFWCASRRRVRTELDAALAVLHELGARPRFFRAPVGIKNLPLARELQRRELLCVGWTIRSGDCMDAHPETTARRVLNRVKPGSILLLHEGSSLHANVRVQAIEQILARLAQRGLRCVVPTPSQLS